FGAEGSISGGSYETWRYRGLAQGPIVADRLFLTLAGQYAASDGFIRNTTLGSRADRQKGLNGRASLKWTPRKEWDVSLVATMDRFRDGLGIVSLAGDPRETASDFDGRIDTDANSQSLRVRRAFPRIAVVSVTTRRDFRVHPFKLDPDFSPFPGNIGVVTRKEPQWTEELRAWPARPGNGWSWNAGLFFSTSKTKTERAVDFVFPPSGSGYDDIRSEGGAETYALFG